MSDTMLWQLIWMMFVIAVLFIVYLVFPFLFFLLAGIAVMGAFVFGIRSLAYMIDRRTGGGRLE